jgi:hypothetical protein
MTTIRERILARADLAPLRAARDLDGLAAALNAEGLTEIRETWVDFLGVLNRCPSGDSIMRKLEAAASADAIVAGTWRSLVYGKGLDFGAQSTRQRISAMASPLGFTDGEVAELMNLAVQPVYVTRSQVFEAMFNDDGSEK